MATADSLQARIDALKQEHRRLFGDAGTIQVFNAPGRINIIGEHTDYNGGYVLPAAIDISILAAATLRNDRQLHLKSQNFPDKVAALLDGLTFSEQRSWANFPLSAAWALEKHGIRLPGADIVFQGDIPLGSGLSSSAAIEVLMMKTMLALAGRTIDKTLIPVYCREGENGFIGVKSGIMDQFIITFGRENNALFLNCETLEHRLIPFCNADTAAVIVGNTKVKRELAKSAYNQRVEECAEGLRILRSRIGRNDIPSLSGIDREEFDRCRSSLPDLIARRCEHVIYENERVIKAVDALEKGDLKTLGKLLVASHTSLKELYEVSCRELDCMVEAFLQSGDVYGARMTGAGFGGSAIALAKADGAADVIKNAQKVYEERTGINGEFYICRIADGARELSV
ncbi:MAG: galactokinase [Chitinispirillaceae bacterium]|nr:galactokinase [Chitinispirillaceae bacterium]